jgi:RNA polymerase sigma factor (sigma-70 family)
MDSREYCAELVNKILSGDQDAFQIFYEQYDNIFWRFAYKYGEVIRQQSFGLYTLSDVHNEIWEGIWRKLPQYDAERSNIVTWLYIICNGIAGKILRKYNAKKEQPENGIGSLNEICFDDSEIELIDMLVDPRESLENQCISELNLYQYIYSLKKFIEGLSNQEKRVYLLNIKGLNQTAIANIIGTSQAQVSRVIHKLVVRATELYDKFSLTHSEQKKADKFAIALLGPESDYHFLQVHIQMI